MPVRVAQYFPAKPDRYAVCETCDIDRAFCGAAGLPKADAAFHAASGGF
ncbi:MULTISPECIES: hypothetical protein [unclassified Neisseria]|nr:MULTISPECIES: hypothetical protein [unclassified Neisseria]MBF0803000.1 hypothetical protein [Neisseria sp. 19428wB4_WF04]